MIQKQGTITHPLNTNYFSFLKIFSVVVSSHSPAHCILGMLCILECSSIELERFLLDPSLALPCLPFRSSNLHRAKYPERAKRF